MPRDLSPEAWAQIRADYEQSERPVEDICAEHGISSGTLRDRMRRWRWMRRRPPVPLDGPPPPSPAPQIDAAAASCRTTTAPETAAGPAAPPPATPGGAAGERFDAQAEPDDRPIAARLQSAVERVLPAIEATVGTLGTGPMHPREMERAARALTSLTRTLRELKSLLGQHRPPPPAGGDRPPADPDELRRELARKIDALVATRLDARERLMAQIDGR